MPISFDTRFDPPLLFFIKFALDFEYRLSFAQIRDAPSLDVIVNITLDIYIAIKAIPMFPTGT